MRDGSSTEEDEILLHTPSEKRPLSNLEMSISLQFDKSNEDNIAEVPQYAQTVFAYMRNEEYKYMISPMYMSVQPSISWKMRRMLIDWLVDVSIHSRRFKTLNALYKLSSRRYMFYVKTKACFSCFSGEHFVLF